MKKKEKYIRSHETLRNEIEETNKQAAKLSSEGRTNSVNFWKLKNQIENQKQNDPYDTITKDGRKITNPQETKDYIAGYYEQLYQAREGTQEYEKWTNHIKHTVRKNRKNPRKSRTTTDHRWKRN